MPGWKPSNEIFAIPVLDLAYRVLEKRHYYVLRDVRRGRLPSLLLYVLCEVQKDTVASFKNVNNMCHVMLTEIPENQQYIQHTGWHGAPLH